jgi:hypothetical protein
VLKTYKNGGFMAYFCCLKRDFCCLKRDFCLFLHDFEEKNVFFEAFLGVKNDNFGLFGVKKLSKMV